MRYRMSEGMANIGTPLKEAMERTPKPDGSLINEGTKKPEQEPVALPDDFELLPVDPTPEMKSAAVEVELFDSDTGKDYVLSWEEAEQIYSAMLNAAPTPPQPKEPEQREPTKQEHNILMGALKRSGKVVAQPKQEQEPAIFLKEWSDWRDIVVFNIMRHGSIDKHLAKELANHFQSMTPQPKEPEQEPVAVVTGVYGGRFIVEPANSAMVLPVNMALYAHPQPRKPLTRGQIREIEVDVSLNPSFDYITPAEQLCRAIEAAHGIKE